MKKIVTIGGGTGHSQVLKGLKSIPGLIITAICPSTDSGGSTGKLLREYDGNGYIGDLTKCIIALSNDETLAKALSYRYESGSLDNHSVKNLLVHALEKTSNTKEALKEMYKICGLGINKVIPATNEKAELCVTLKIGNTIFGETNIDTIAKNPLWNPDVHSIKDIYLKPEVKVTAEVLSSVKDSDYIVICPGDLYSSVIPVLLPKGIKKAIENCKAKIIIILNIMTKKGETDNYTTADFIKNIESHLGRKADYIICNNKHIPTDILLKYSLESKMELGNPDLKDKRIISAPLLEVINEVIFSSPKVIKNTISKIIN